MADILFKPGRPREVSFSEEEMVQLGEEMVEFVKDKKNNVLHLSEWYTIHKGFIYNEWKTFIQRKEFVPYYQIALKLVGKRYLDGTINPGVSHRWQRIYFGDLKEAEDQDCLDKLQRDKDLIEWTEKLKSSGIAVDANTMAALANMMNQISSLQSSKQARKMAEMSDNADTSS